MKKKSEKDKTADRKYLTTGLLLCGGGIGLLLLTGLLVVFADILPIIIPVGAGVLLLIGSGSILKWMFGDKIMWD